MITACSPPYGDCIDAVNFGQVIKGDYVIQGDGYYSSTPRYNNYNPNAYGQWYKTDISLSKGQGFNITTVGTVYYCNTQSTTLSFCPKYSLRKGTGINLRTGDFLVLNLLGGGGIDYAPRETQSGVGRCDSSGTSSKTFTNGECYGYDGIGIQVYIGNTLINDLNKRFDPSEQQMGGSLQGYYFSDGLIRGMYLKVPNDGELQFQAYDNCNCPGDNNVNCSNTDSKCCFYDNRGSYSLNAKVLGCPVNNGQTSGTGALQILITSGDPNNGSSTSNATTLSDGTFSGAANDTGTLWLRVYDTTPNSYQNNSGEYYIHVSADNSTHTLSNLISGLVDPIKDQVRLASTAIYSNLAGNSYFHRIVVSLINLYIIVYAIFFIVGLVQISQIDLVIRLFKIGVLLNLINSNTSWGFFTQNLFNLFVGGSDYLLATVTTTNTVSPGTSGLFIFVNQTVGQFFTEYTWIKITSLLFSITGIAYACILVATMIIYMLAIVEAIMSYLFALIAVSLMIAVAPIFIACVLFNRTKELFDNWLKYIINFSLQPVILFACIMFINKLVLLSFYQTVSFRVCWGCAIPFYFSLFGLFKVKLFCYNYYLPYGAANAGNTDLPSVLTATGGTLFALFVLLLMFLIFSKLMSKIADLAPEITNWITGALGVNFSGKGSQSRAIMNSMKDLAKGAIGQDKGSKQRRKDRSEINDIKSKEKDIAKEKDRCGGGMQRGGGGSEEMPEGDGSGGDVTGVGK
ncbi:MAG: type IV secretion system protein [Rickettsiales endosymbiont of Dermacentor nuttalli]